MDPDVARLAQVLMIVAGFGIVSGTAWVVLHGLARRLGRRPEPPRLPAVDAARMERIEQAVDAIALEVERIAEAQRFTTKLLSERSGASEGRR